jgi:hypothetical protein
MVMISVIARPAISIVVVVAMFLGLSRRHVVAVPSCFAALVPTLMTVALVMFAPLA